MEKKTSPCTECWRNTESIRKRRAKYICKECGHDKSLSDSYYYAMMEEE